MNQLPSDEIRAVAERATQALVDEGRFIEAGWINFKMLVIPPGACDEQYTAMRLSYYAGAQHLFNTFTSVFNPSAEPTEADLKRMTFIYAELVEFQKSFAPAVVEPQRATPTIVKPGMQ